MRKSTHFFLAVVADAAFPVVSGTVAGTIVVLDLIAGVVGGRFDGIVVIFPVSSAKFLEILVVEHHAYMPARSFAAEIAASLEQLIAVVLRLGSSQVSA